MQQLVPVALAQVNALGALQQFRALATIVAIVSFTIFTGFSVKKRETCDNPLTN